MPKYLRNSLIATTTIAGGVLAIYYGMFKKPGHPSLGDPYFHVKHFLETGDYHEKATSHTRDSVNRIVAWAKEKEEQAADAANDAKEHVVEVVGDLAEQISGKISH